MSSPIFTLILADKVNNCIFTKEYESEGDAQRDASQYPSSFHGDILPPKEWDVEYSIVFGVELTTGATSRLPLGGA